MQPVPAQPLLTKTWIALQILGKTSKKKNVYWQSYNSWFGAPGAPGAPETLKLQVDRRSELVWFAKGNEINISDFCIANTKDIKCQL